MQPMLAEMFPACRAAAGSAAWDSLSSGLPPYSDTAAEGCIEALGRALIERIHHAVGEKLPPWLADLARIELAMTVVCSRAGAVPQRVDTPTANPALELVEVGWRGLDALIRREQSTPESEGMAVLVWFDPLSGSVRAESADVPELLALKLAVEGADAERAVREIGATQTDVREVLHRATGRGLVLLPASRIRREPGFWERDEAWAEEYRHAEVFTLQWHLTQACDLHCKHCYDRSSRSPLTLERGLGVLEQFDAFCRARHVCGQASFSGGNSLMYQHFMELYHAAAGRGFMLGILGNPTTRQVMEALLRDTQAGVLSGQPGRTGGA